MLWVKAFHVVLVIAFMSGVFYLPRILVNLAMIPGQGGQGPDAERDRLLLMARKLYRFTHILGGVALVPGLWLWLGFGIGQGPGNGWMHAKLLCVLLLYAYLGFCGGLLRQFQQGVNRRSHVWLRWFNEVPVLLLVAIVILVVVKPF